MTFCFKRERKSFLLLSTDQFFSDAVFSWGGKNVRLFQHKKMVKALADLIMLFKLVCNEICDISVIHHGGSRSYT